MKDYIANILPRITELSKTLDRKEIFVDKAWVMLDEQGNKQQYIFRRDGRLLMSLNGAGQEGKWEYIPAAKSLWIDRGIDKIMLNQAFIDDAVLILKMDGTNQQPWMLANIDKVPNLDIKEYLKRLYNQKYQAVEFESITGDTVVVHGSLVNGINFNMPVFVNEQPATAEQIQLKSKLIIGIKAGKVASLHWEKTYDTLFGPLTIIQADQFTPLKGDTVITAAHLPADEYITIADEKIKIKIKDGVVVKVKNKYNAVEMIVPLFILALVIAVIFFVLVFIYNEFG